MMRRVIVCPFRPANVVVAAASADATEIRIPASTPWPPEAAILQRLFLWYALGGLSVVKVV